MNPYVLPGIKRSIDDIIAEVFEVDIRCLYSKTRVRPAPEARQFGMWYRCKHKGNSTTAAAMAYNRDHATTIFSCKTVENLMQTNKVFRSKAIKALEMLEQLKK